MEYDKAFNYRVVVTPDVEIALAKCVDYLIREKQSLQAADNVLSDCNQYVS